MKIGDVAAELGVSTDTIRFYEKRGLIHADRQINGYRDFSPVAVQTLHLIRVAQALGFTLGEIAQITKTLSDTAMDADAVAELLRGKISEVEAKAADLLRLRDMLQARLDDVCPLQRNA
ncbi:MerR family transcriptional regulator [Cognatiyoonia sp. IB215446]|uniref:MerR family transcriptional regulator n=1 Tax=Cognatiyoonia sp. IB215446 TaxID=3097355 RepID=UPI002A0C4A1D|nr:MerR family transcriptional regulator [Cognatiyoonia sp. IB215446]MDX8347635.1 MerR family transcriptional regulator [Cognatiyoonia sp. IB215446]